MLGGLQRPGCSVREAFSSDAAAAALPAQKAGRPMKSLMVPLPALSLGLSPLRPRGKVACRMELTQADHRGETKPIWLSLKKGQHGTAHPEDPRDAGVPGSKRGN